MSGRGKKQNQPKELRGEVSGMDCYAPLHEDEVPVVEVVTGNFYAVNAKAADKYCITFG
jgi:hypothetical protein